MNVSRSVVLAGFSGFLIIGAVQAFYGAAQFELRSAFAVDAVAVGAFSSVLFAGSVVGIVVCPIIERWTGLKLALLISSAALALGMVGVSVVRSWELTLLSVLLIGLGFGGLNIGFNLLFSTAFGQRSATYSNALNAMFGIGSILGPILIGVSNSYRLSYGWGSLVALGLMVLIASARLPLRNAAAVAPSRLRFSALLSGVLALFFMYVVVEVGAAGAAPRHLRDALGYSEQNAAFLNALFWGGLTVGRLIGAVLALRVAAAQLVIASSGLLLASLASSHWAALAPFAYTLAGVACGPIFPSGLVWLSQVSRGNSAIASLVVASASLGGVIAPFAVGAFTGSNAGAIPSVLTALAAVLFTLNLTVLNGLNRDQRV